MYWRGQLIGVCGQELSYGIQNDGDSDTEKNLVFLAPLDSESDNARLSSALFEYRRTCRA